MNIAVFGSTCYRDIIEEHASRVEGRTCFFDSEWSEIDTSMANRSLIEWADEVHFLWDGRSQGVIFDMGMCFALRKRIKIVHQNSRSLSNLFKQIEESSHE